MHRNHLMNRQAFVERLVAFLGARPVVWTAAMVEALSTEQRAVIAHQVGEKRTGSDDSWNWIAAEMVRRERTVAA